MRPIAFAWLCIVPLVAAQPPRFRVSVEAVRVDVLVLDGDKPVAGLTARDFELRDAGVVQHIDAISYEDEPVRVMLALDTSLSVNGEPLSHLRDAAGAVVSLMTPRDRAAVLTFSSEVNLACAWTADRARLARALDRSRGEGSTALYDAAYSALISRDLDPGRALVLLFSDGDDTASWLSGEDVLDAARRADVVVYAVGVRPRHPVVTAGFRVEIASGVQHPMPNLSPLQLLERFLPALARETGGTSIDVEATGRLREAFVRILREFRTRYVITYTPHGVERTGWHPIEVKLQGRRGKVTARRGYLR